MPIQFYCNGCSRQLQVPDEAAGNKAKCPACGLVSIVPGVVQAEEYGVDWSSDETGHQPPPPGVPVAPSYAAGAYTVQPGSPFMPPLAPRYFNIGEAWNDTWMIYTQRFGPVIGVALSAMVINIGIGMTQNVVIEIGGQIGQEAKLAFTILANPVSQVFQAWIYIGLFLYMLKTVGDRGPQVSDLFSGGKYLLRYIGAVLLFTLGGLVIVTVFALPVVGLFISGGNQIGPNGINADTSFWVIGGSISAIGLICLTFYYLTFALWPMVLIDRNAGVFESLGTSAMLMRGNRLKYFFIMLVVGIATTLFGIVTCCIGWIFAMPFMYLIMAVLYYHIAGLPVRRGYKV